MGVQEAGAGHDLGPDQGGCNGGNESVLHGLVHGHGQHGDLQPGHVTAQEVEAGTGNLDAPAHVDASHAHAQVQVVLGLEALLGEVARGTDLLDHHVVVLAALGRLGLHYVAELPHEIGVLGIGLVGG